MSKHHAVVSWDSGGALLVSKQYSRDHTWRMNGIELPASASTDIVPARFVGPQRIDPEAALVAAVSSCHMLWFLHLCSLKGLDVRSYVDEAEGVMERGTDGKLSFTRFILRPDVRFEPVDACDDATEFALHEEAHMHCFIANSIKGEVEVMPYAKPEKVRN